MTIITTLCQGWLDGVEAIISVMVPAAAAVETVEVVKTVFGRCLRNYAHFACSKCAITLIYVQSRHYHF